MSNICSATYLACLAEASLNAQNVMLPLSSKSQSWAAIAKAAPEAEPSFGRKRYASESNAAFNVAWFSNFPGHNVLHTTPQWLG